MSVTIVVLLAPYLIQSVLCSAWTFPEMDWDTARQWNKGGSAWGGFGLANEGARNAYGREAGGHEYGERDHSGYSRGDEADARKFSEFVTQAADGHIAKALESGEQALAEVTQLSEVEGNKKYKYFAQGQTPQLIYAKGYYGSDDFGHETAKSAHVKNADHGGYRKGFEVADRDSGLAHSAWDKHGDLRERLGHDNHHGAWSQRGGDWGQAGHGDGWRDGNSDYIYDRHHQGHPYHWN